MCQPNQVPFFNNGMQMAPFGLFNHGPVGAQAMSQEIGADLLFMSLMVANASVMFSMSPIGVARHLKTQGYCAPFTAEQSAAIEAYASSRSYPDFGMASRSPHRHFILRASGMTTMHETLMSYLTLIVGCTVSHCNVNGLSSLIEQCRGAEHIYRAQTKAYMPAVSETDSDFYLAKTLSELGPIPVGDRSAIVTALRRNGFLLELTPKGKRLVEQLSLGCTYATYEDLASSIHRSFILALTSVVNGMFLLNYIRNVAKFGNNFVIDLERVIDLCRKMQYNYDMGVQNPMKGFNRQQVCGVSLPAPVLDHGFRPRRVNGKQAGNNSVFIYHVDTAPLILNAEMETTYHVNGYLVLLHMNNFSSIEDVEVEVHESIRNDLPGLLATEMDGSIFRRYFDPTKRNENAKALALVIK